MAHIQKVYGLFSLFFNENTKGLSKSINDALGTGKKENSILVLDGLRAIACLSVLFFHFRWLTSQHISLFPLHGHLTYVTAFFLFGNAGVILFFLLSGFLLFLPFAKALLLEEQKWPSIRRFYLRRVFRIIPAYYIALILLLLFFHPEFLHVNQWQVISKFLTFRMNYNLAQQVNGVFWTLAVEFQFYMLLPFIVWITRPFVRSTSVHWRVIQLGLCLLVMIGWGIAIRYWVFYFVDTTNLDWLLSHTVRNSLRLLLYGDPGPPESGKYFEVFGLGMLVCTFYVYLRYVPQTAKWSRITERLSVFLMLIGLCSLAFLSVWNLYFINIGASSALEHLFHSYQSYFKPIWLVWRPFLIGLTYALCMFALLHGPKWLKHPLEWNPFRWLGAISYSLYIWHMPLALLFFGYFFSDIHNRSHAVQYIITFLWVVIVIFPFSVLSYRLVEQPGVRFGEYIIRWIERQRKTPGVLRGEDIRIGHTDAVASQIDDKTPIAVKA